MILVKIGGSEKLNISFICEDIAKIWKKEKLIVVHGAGKIRDKIAEKLGYPTKIILSPSGIPSVLTDEKAMEIFLMVYAGLVNKKIVLELQKFKINAVGLCGIDGRLWEGKRKKILYFKENGKIKILKNTFTGKVEIFNKRLVEILIENGFLPVICPPAISFENEAINVDNDLAIASMVKALKIKKIISLFEAPGFLLNPDDEKTKIDKIEKKEIEKYLNVAQGGMKKKLMGAKLALEAGVKEIYFGDGRVKNPIERALSGDGTRIS